MAAKGDRERQLKPPEMDFWKGATGKSRKDIVPKETIKRMMEIYIYIYNFIINYFRSNVYGESLLKMGFSNSMKSFDCGNC